MESTCLSQEVASFVKNIGDDLVAMWKPLDEKYSDPAKVIDIVMNTVQNTKTLKDGENKKLAEFINTSKTATETFKDCN